MKYSSVYKWFFLGLFWVSLLPVRAGQDDCFQLESYEDILSISNASQSSSSFHGGFSDQGTWMSFNLPAQSDWKNGFVGPYHLDDRYWISDALLQVGFTDTPKEEQFRDCSAHYYPGYLSLKSMSSQGILTQKIFFYDKYTAFWSCSSDSDAALYVESGILNRASDFQVSEHGWSWRLVSGERVQVIFPSSVSVSYADHVFRAYAPQGVNLFATITFFHDNRADVTAYTQEMNELLVSPSKAIEEHQKRWQGYLKSVIRPEMPLPYSRIAVKTMVTLLSNWRSPKGDLRHDGVIPSHAVGYFTGFWAWDSWKHAVALSLFAPELAKNQIRAMLDFQQEDGMIPDCVYTDSRENNYRDSKPPLAAWALQAVYEATGDVDFVREIYPKLLKYHRWWYTERDHDRNGYCEFGSEDGTLEAAAWESGMDNAIRFDGASMVKNGSHAWSMNQESVDLNAFLALDYQLLRGLASVIGEEFTEPNRTADVATYFYDEQYGFFHDRKLESGNFVRVDGSEAYIPFWANIASQVHMDAALPFFKNPNKMGTYIPFPTVSADNPKFSSNGYWRGPIWLDQVYFGIHGLRNYGQNELADEYTKRVFNRLSGLRLDSPIHENYDTHTGQCLKSAHFSWSAAHLLLMYRECGVLEDDGVPLCLFTYSYRNFAYISQVDLAGIHQKTRYEQKAWYDFTASTLACLEAGKTYPLRVEVRNYDSGAHDAYKLRVWVDWNANSVLEREELIDTKRIAPIGKSGKVHTFNFDLAVPQDVMQGKGIKCRVFLHFVESETDGEDPCGWVDSGVAHDYLIRVGDESEISELSVWKQAVYDPDVDMLYVSDSQVLSWEVYQSDGRRVIVCPRGVTYASLSEMPAGVYVLRVLLTDGSSYQFKFLKQ